MRAAVRAGAETLMVHGLLGRGYAAAVAARRPDVLTAHISSLLPRRRDTFGRWRFALSAVAACAARADAGGPQDGGTR